MTSRRLDKAEKQRLVHNAIPIDSAAILGVIDAASHELDQLLPTLNVPAVVAPA
jgi:hypothetical protein